MRPSDLNGPAGSAWEVPQTGKGWEACLSFHYINLPNYHPMLKWFVVVTSHLRDTPGQPTPSKQSSDCTHELIIASVDPETYLFEDLDPDTFDKLKLLEPLEVWHQFQGLTDPGAIEIGGWAIRRLLDNKLEPNHEDKAIWTKFLQEAQAESRLWHYGEKNADK